MNLDSISATISGYKCFDDPQGFETILPINIIIGRNNCGKSALVDLVQYLTSPYPIEHLRHKGRTSQAVLTCTMSRELIEAVKTSLGGHFDDIVGDLWGFALRELPERRIHFEIGEKGTPRVVAIEPSNGIPDSHIQRLGDAVLNTIGNPFSKYQFKRIASDRDIQPEKDEGSLELMQNGRWATNIVQSLINKEQYPSELIEETLLGDLNSILEPDVSFTRIVVQQREKTTDWEIQLDEAKKGRVPMSHTGSGVKTVLLVLINLLVEPFLRRKPLSEFLFGFEELENNLHPASQRRLFLYLRRKAIEEKCRFFLTTHSSVVIDLFGKDQQAQILHVTHDGQRAQVDRVFTYGQGQSVLNDLGVRASDLLQSNVIVWVEGPSDRIYFNRWIDLWSDGKLMEDVHYQCLPYGGSLIAHLSFEDPDAIEHMIQALRVNRHAIVLIDSDKRAPNDALKKNAERIATEIGAIGGIAWISDGKEVENYIPWQALHDMYGDDSLQPEQHEDLFDCLEKAKAGEGRWRENKVAFAKRVCPHITQEGLRETLDLREKLDAVCDSIRQWNGLPSV